MDKIDEYFEKALITKKGTTTVFRSHIKKYFTVIEKDMETYFDKKQPYEEHIRKYWKYLQGKAPKTRSVAVCSIKGFLKRHDKDTKELDIWDDIAVRMKGNTSPVSEEHVPDIDELKQILNYCDIRTKTIITMLLSSGMRIGEIVGILPGDVHMNETPTRINIRAEIAKKGKRRTTFITEEATELLREWLRIRDDYIKKSMASMNFKSMQYIKGRNDPRIFPYHTNRIREAFNQACDKAGFTGKTIMNGDFDHKVRKDGEKMRKRGRRKLHYHNLRKFFRTYFGNSDLAEALMGHSGYLSEYRMYNDKQLAEAYEKFKHNVSIYTATPDLTEVRESLSQKKTEIDELKQEVFTLRSQIGDFQKLMEDPQKARKLLKSLLQMATDKEIEQIKKEE